MSRAPLHPLASTVEVAASYADEVLVGPRARSALMRVAGQIPAALANCLYFERWLWPDLARADLIVRVDAHGRSVLTAHDERLLAGEPLASTPGWHRVVSLAHDWGDTASILHHIVARIWVELDLEMPVDGTPAIVTPDPRLFIDFTQASRSNPSVQQRMRDACTVIERCRGPATARRLADPVRSVLDALPADAYLFSIGTGASPGGVRVCVAGLVEETIPKLLNAVGWPGDVGALTHDVIERFGSDRRSGARIAMVHLDVESSTGVRVGLEYGFQPCGTNARLGLWAAWLAALAADGLCPPHVRDALLGWEGAAIEALPHELWRTRLARRLNHVKIVFGDRGLQEVKAYLCAFHQPARSRRPGTGVAAAQPELLRNGKEVAHRGAFTTTTANARNDPRAFLG